MTHARLTLLDGGASIAESFDAATRIGDVAGVLQRAAHAPRRGHRGTKLGGKRLTVAEIRAEQSAAWMLGLDEIREHGHSVKVDAAMEILLGAMDDEMRAWAAARRDSGGPAETIRAGRDQTLARGVGSAARISARPSPSTRHVSVRAEGAAEGAPPSGTRPLLAADREYQRLRRAALDAVDDLAGGFGGGVVRVGIGMAPTTQRKLADAAKALSAAAWEPSRGGVAQAARRFAALARGLASTVLRKEAERAAEACAALAAYVEQWTEARRA